MVRRHVHFYTFFLDNISPIEGGEGDIAADAGREGLCLGGSSGINVAGAIRLAEKLGPGHTIVTVLCDSGERYRSRLYNPEVRADRGLPAPSWLNRVPRPSARDFPRPIQPESWKGTRS